MHTIDSLIRKALWIFGPSAFAILLAIAFNSALKSDGLYIGNPRLQITYIEGQKDPRLQQLAAAIDQRQLRNR